MISIHAPLHVAINVSDLSRAEAFYGGVLGLKKVDRALKFPGTWYQVGEFQLHLIEAADWRTSPQHPKWGRNAHVAFAIADVEAAKFALMEADCPVQASASGRPALFTQDPDGNIIELTQVV
jgi:catechol 2,3-dioxygenase-like lactoylglutathione lyase family enzyme